ncbi:uncharacterized protein RHOBADRAFT_16687, partial [Rhodotorula graminis WP1]
KTIKGSWTAAEDAKLVELVDEFGSEKWVIISSQMGSRSGKQCRERWHNHLNPNIKKSDWSPEEDALIRDLHAKIGPRWAEMAKHLPGRPDNSIKNYWNACVPSLLPSLPRRRGPERPSRVDPDLPILPCAADKLARSATGPRA